MKTKEELNNEINLIKESSNRLFKEKMKALEIFIPRQQALDVALTELHEQLHKVKLAEERELIVSALHTHLTCNPSLKRGTVWLYVDNTWYDHAKSDHVIKTVRATSAVEAVRKVLPIIIDEFPEARYFLVTSDSDLEEDEVIVDTSDWSIRPSDSEYTGGGIP